MVSDRPIRVAAFSRARSACSAWIRAVCSVIVAVTNGLPSRSAPIQLPNRRNAGASGAIDPDASPCSATVERPVHTRRQAEQRLVEHRRARSHLIQRLHGLAAKRRGTPEQVDLLAEPPPGLGMRRCAEAGAVEGVELGADAAQRLGDRPPPGLGRMRRQDRCTSSRPSSSPRRCGPIACPRRGHGSCEGLAHWLGTGVALAQRADPLVLLGQVRQVEIHSEGARDRLGTRPAASWPPAPLCPHRPSLRRQPQVGRIRIEPARGDHAMAQVLHVVEQILAA